MLTTGRYCSAMSIYQMALADTVFGIRERHISGEKMGENVSQRTHECNADFYGIVLQSVHFSPIYFPFFENLLISRMHKHASR